MLQQTCFLGLFPMLKFYHFPTMMVLPCRDFTCSDNIQLSSVYVGMFQPLHQYCTVAENTILNLMMVVTCSDNIQLSSVHVGMFQPLHQYCTGAENTILNLMMVVTCFKKQNDSVNTSSSNYGRTVNKTMVDGNRIDQEGLNVV